MIGHAKAVCLNFGIAQEFGGRCHLRFDDTNPTKEEQRYIDAIKDDIRWPGWNTSITASSARNADTGSSVNIPTADSRQKAPEHSCPWRVPIPLWDSAGDESEWRKSS